MKQTLLMVACVLLLLAGVADAAYFDFQQITVDNTSGGVKLTASKVLTTIVSVTCRIRTAEISALWVDPTVTVVTSSVGILLEPGDTLILTSREEMLNLRMIRTGSTSGQADCSFKSNLAP